MTRRVRVRGLAIVVVGTLLAVSACAGGSSTSARSAPAGALATFAGAFDGGIGHRRLVLLLSPT
jgi:hypothetical protein